jgi:HCOMODA/2-hydroxy-3-carboxy-muconic semialdehyde decarboxylase
VSTGSRPLAAPVPAAPGPAFPSAGGPADPADGSAAEAARGADSAHAADPVTPADGSPGPAAAAVAGAARVLAGLGLVTAFGHVSQRSGPAMLITPAADLAVVTADRLVTVDLAARELPPGAPAEAWAHLAVYQARPDVTAVARAQPPAALAAAAVAGAALPPLYGQACWLGPRVPVHADARLLRSADLAAPAAAALGRCNALLLRGNGALTCGSSPGLAVARMWLLAAACQAWLAAAAAGPPALLSPAEIQSWQATAGELLPRLWQHLERTTGHPHDEKRRSPA